MEGFLEIISGGGTTSQNQLIPLPIVRERGGPSAPSAESWFTVGPLPSCNLVLHVPGWEREGIALQWNWRLASWNLRNLSYALLEVDGQRIAFEQSIPLLGWTAILSVGGLPVLRFLR